MLNYYELRGFRSFHSFLVNTAVLLVKPDSGTLKQGGKGASMERMCSYWIQSRHNRWTRIKLNHDKPTRMPRQWLYNIHILLDVLLCSNAEYWFKSGNWISCISFSKKLYILSMGFGKYVVELLYELLSNSPVSCTFDFNEPRLQKLVLSLFVLYLTGENLFWGN